MHRWSQLPFITIACFCVSLLLIGVPAMHSQILEKIMHSPLTYEHEYPKSVHHVHNLGFPQKMVDSTLDVHRYDISLDWYKLITLPLAERGPHHFTGSVRITFGVTKPVNRIRLSAADLAVTSVVSESVVITEVRTDADILIVFDRVLDVGRAYVITIDYVGLQSRKGVYGYSATEISETEPFSFGCAFMFTEPTQSRYVYPCNDAPHDKALFTVAITLPHGYTGVSNGTLMDVVPRTDSTSEHHWRHDKPMPTYLFSVAASVYDTLMQEGESINGNRIPIANYFWARDRDSTRYSAVRSLANIPSMLAALETYFGPYPFESYGHVFGAPMEIGAMEHQTMVLVNRRWLEGDIEPGFAHELGHHWSGNIVSCGSWPDIWLNEGGATWSEALWRLHKEGPSGYRSQMEARRTRYLKTALIDPPIYDPPMSILFNEGSTYCKSAWVMHMMYRQEGQRFLDALQEWYRRDTPVSRQTFEFIEFIADRIPNPVIAWSTFFDQWLLQQYHPVVYCTLNVDSISSTGQSHGSVAISQMQQSRGFDTEFHFPLTIRFISDQQSADTTVLVTSAQMVVQFRLPFRPTSITIDPERNVLLEDSITVTTMNDVTPDQNTLSIPGALPHIVSQPLIVHAASGSTVRVYATDGTLVDQALCVHGNVIFDTRSWFPGMYAVHSQHGHRSQQSVFIMVR